MGVVSNHHLAPRSNLASLTDRRGRSLALTWEADVKGTPQIPAWEMMCGHPVPQAAAKSFPGAAAHSSALSLSVETTWLPPEELTCPLRDSPAPQGTHLSPQTLPTLLPSPSCAEVGKGTLVISQALDGAQAGILASEGRFSTRHEVQSVLGLKTKGISQAALSHQGSAAMPSPVPGSVPELLRP